MNPTMPTPPEGHYWRIRKASTKGFLRVYLMARRQWWFDDEVGWDLVELSRDEHTNALRAVAAARYVLRHRTAQGMNGLTGYVDIRGREH